MMFDPRTITDAKIHAIREFPKESCGIVTAEKYIPCENVHIEPDKHFRIDPAYFLRSEKENGKSLAIIHSHVEGPDYPSMVDMQTQQDMAVPWGIILVKEGEAKDPFWFGDQLPIPPLVGRKFRSGIADCYSIVRDWYRLHTDILLPNYPRDPSWWTNGPSMPDTFFEEAGFYEVLRSPGEKDVLKMKEGDLILAKVASKVTNHTGIYLGNGLIVHHMVDKISCREPIGPRMHRIVRVGRHKDLHHA